MVVKNFDRLSDKLCGVIDMCESIWTSHPDDKWKQEAGRVYEELCRVMNEMNVDQELYNVSRSRPSCESGGREKRGRDEGGRKRPEGKETKFEL